ncbi:hypothetical protein ABZ835_34880 [Streptomyces sp. NPDC047461]|uniref:hypothetical protein n=1 Tax=Streptomyces sp. NPDC047461 TaxID=3155619 RepID=UPI0033EF3D2B
MFGRDSAAVVVVCVLALAGCTFEGGGSTAAEATETEVSAASTPASSSEPASASPSTIPTGSPSASASASLSPTPVPVRSPGQTLVSMNISGGFAGVGQSVVLRGDGTVRARDDREGSVVRRTTAAEFRELRLLLGDPALDDVSDFTMNMSAADLFQYEVRFEGRTVRTDRSAEQPPLDALISALSAFLPKG